MPTHPVKLVLASAGVMLALATGASANTQPASAPAADQPPVQTVERPNAKLPSRSKIRARANGHVTLNRAKWVSASQTMDVAAGFGRMAKSALAACGAPHGAAATAAAVNIKYALRLTTFGRVTAGWTAALLTGFQRFTGNNFCDIAYRASGGAAWAAYHGSQGRRVWMYIFVFQENRTLAPDVCHTYVAMNGTWRVWDLKTSSLGSGCPS